MTRCESRKCYHRHGRYFSKPGVFVSVRVLQIVREEGQIKRSNSFDFILENSELFLSYFLIVIAAYMLAVMDKEIRKERVNLEKVNEELFTANKMLVESMDEIAGLYKLG